MDLEKPPLDLNEYPSPYLVGILDDYLTGKCRYLGLQTSRGCPFNCAYCVWNIQWAFEGLPKIRYFSLDRVIEELKYIKRKTKGKVGIEIYDATFNENRNRLRNLCQEIKDNKIDLKFGVRLRADLLNDEQIEMLKSMGVWIVRVGIESIGDSLKIVNRIQSQTKMDTNLMNLRKKGIYISGNIMIGLPEQTKEEVTRTIEYVKKLNINVFTVNVYDPPSGTDLYNDPAHHGLIEFRVTEDGRKFFETSFLNRKELIELARKGNMELNSVPNELLKIYKRLVTFS